MSVSGINSLSSAANVRQSPPVTSTTTDANGDYKSAGAGRVKDSDGDYVSASRPTTAVSSSSVQAALTNLKAGG